MKNTVKRSDLFDRIYGLKNDQHFALKFKKLNGEERTYNDCQMHVIPEAATGTGITTNEAHLNYDCLKFYCNDVEGYRTAKIANIISFECDNILNEVVE